MEDFKEIVIQKWIVIWVITTLMKLTIQIRWENFSWVVFLTDMFLACVIWYISWEIVATKDMMNIFKYIFVAFMSGNAFVLVSILFNPDLAKKIMLTFLWKTLDIKMEENAKKNK